MEVSNPYRDFTIDATCGAIASVCGIIFGAPLDIIKTKLQSSPHLYNNSSITCLKQTVRKDGAHSLFRGTGAASLSAFPNSFIVFGIYAQTARYLESMRSSKQINSSGAEPYYSEIFMSGTFAGLISAVALTPFEEIKVQQQVFTSASSTSSSLTSKPPLSMLECGKRIINEAGVKGMFRGLTSVLIRDSPTYGLYFASYEFIKYEFSSRQPLQSDGIFLEPEWWVLMTAGSVAGVVSWMVGLPSDVIKSNIQGAPLLSVNNNNNFRSVAKRIYERDGFAGFTRGIWPLLIRSVPVNGITFLVYDKLLGVVQ